MLGRFIRSSGAVRLSSTTFQTVRTVVNTPHGGKLTPNMLNDTNKIDEAIASCKGITMELNDRQLCDVELITNGAFSPLQVSGERPLAHVVNSVYLRLTCMRSTVY